MPVCFQLTKLNSYSTLRRAFTADTVLAHVLEQLLAKGYSVVTTVRSEDKAQKIRDAYKAEADRLQVAVVPDIGKEDAFDEVVKTPGIEVVLHTASPFHFNWS